LLLAISQQLVAERWLAFHVFDALYYSLVKVPYKLNPCTPVRG
jgi:hypothetical protein